ncbi:hypothetical protein HU200_032339 [Digitaria exilis]|uniref:Endoplasmic reticulum-Golgi intermediate compartment protein 3 n=1 Tax=Digitaria exilis TaxID=1010633 RepID=A0A835ESJ3_9POAL|nr:hypothetical protein HU200_032339 [Digitaria exilis]
MGSSLDEVGVFYVSGKMARIPSLKSLNAFPHAEEHLLKKTYSGAVVTILGLIIMFTLFVHELQFYLTTYTVHQLSVDLKRGETLPIHINMSFPSLPCEGYFMVLIYFPLAFVCLVLSVDAIDMSGKHEVDLHTNIWKLRLDRYGHIIGTEYLSDLVEKGHGAHHDHDRGPEHHDEQKKHEHTFDEDAEKMVKSVKQALENGEGCRVYGMLDVQRVAGNFHISVHGLNIFVAEKIFEGSSHVNVSHVIHDLSFGPKYPGIHNPLDETSRILHDTSGTFKYYIKVSCHLLAFVIRHFVIAHGMFSSVCPIDMQVVPTEYRYLSKKVLPTNQFSVTEYFLPIRPTERAWPGNLSVSPFKRTVGLLVSRFIACYKSCQLCYTGMLDRWMYRLIESVTNSKTRSVLW